MIFMKVTALNSLYKPTDIAVRSARSCFLKNIISSDNAAKWDITLF